MAAGESHTASRACWAAAKSLVVSGGAVTLPILTARPDRNPAIPQFRHEVLIYASAQERSWAWMIAAWAAATRAIGTRNGEHDT